MSKVFIPVILFVALMTGCNTPTSKKSLLSHDQMMANASRSEKNGWIVVHLQGSPEVIGYQHGYLLAAEITDLRGAMAMLNEKTTGCSGPKHLKNIRKKLMELWQE
jgi:hypothetical protein